MGDCFRLGSVGLVVSEMRADGEVEQRIDAKTLEFLKDEALAFDTNGDMATLAADEERLGEYLLWLLCSCCVLRCVCFLKNIVCEWKVGFHMSISLIALNHIIIYNAPHTPPSNPLF